MAAVSKKWNDSDAVCPFFKRHAGDLIACESPVPGSSMCMYFEDKKIKQRQYQTYCCGKYAFCEIYQMDIKKYEE